MLTRALMNSELTIGVVGAGAFARFAARAFGEARGVKVVAVTDTNKEAAERMAQEFDLALFDTMDELLARDRVQLVYIATPPARHYEQTKRALLAGKHVICEKPAALRVCEAEELAVLARSSGLVYAVNLMQRYNPLFGKVAAIIGEGLLGRFRHGYFENYASDENLDEGHWFWDASLSGGIFIEHGVHFFDLFAGWLGEGRVAAAWEWERAARNGRPSDERPDGKYANDGERPGGGPNKIIDRVQASVMYPGGMVNFYHGFNQPLILDRQEMRLQFERGDLTLHEWVPVGMRLHGVLQSGQLDRLKEIMGESKIVHHAKPATGGDHITLEYENPLGKQVLYQSMLTAMIADQFAAIRDPAHVRVIDEGNGVRSLAMAEEATRRAGEAARQGAEQPKIQSGRAAQ
jgi:predicted dehydrogenase